MQRRWRGRHHLRENKVATAIERFQLHSDEYLGGCIRKKQIDFLYPHSTTWWLEDEKRKFQELTLYAGHGRDGDDGLVALPKRMKEVAAAVKATTTAIRNRNKFTVLTRSGRWRRTR